jgi:hypothetical protein
VSGFRHVSHVVCAFSLDSCSKLLGKVHKATAFSING